MRIIHELFFPCKGFFGVFENFFGLFPLSVFPLRCDFPCFPPMFLLHAILRVHPFAETALFPVSVSIFPFSPVQEPLIFRAFRLRIIYTFFGVSIPGPVFAPFALISLIKKI